MPARTKVVLIGGIDVDARLELMHHLSDEFDVGALGSLKILQEKFQKEGFEYVHYSLSRRANPVQDIFTFFQLFFIFRRLRPQIVHTFDTKPCVWGRLAARLAGVPVVVGTLPGLGSLYVRDGLVNQLLRSVYQNLQKAACYFSDITIFQNYDDANQFIRDEIVSARKAVVIPGSGVSTDKFSQERVSDARKSELKEKLNIRDGEIVITMVSRIIRSKGVMEFMEAAQALRSRCENARFLLVGPQDNDSLDRLNPHELKQLSDIVNWRGPLRDIPALLAVTNIFVLPSIYREGIPRVLLEAASMGLPIVTTDSPGCNEVVENGVNGFLVATTEMSLLSQLILRLIEDQDMCRTFGQISRRRAVERFDILVIAEQIRSIYRDLVSGRRF